MPDYSAVMHEGSHAAATEFCGGVCDFITIEGRQGGGGKFRWLRPTDGRVAQGVAVAMITQAPEYVGSEMSPSDKAILFKRSTATERIEAVRLLILNEPQIRVRAAEIASLVRVGKTYANEFLGTPDPFRMGQILVWSQQDAAVRQVAKRQSQDAQGELRRHLGGKVKFVSKGVPHVGTLVAINAKRALVMTPTERWLVPYTELEVL